MAGTVYTLEELKNGALASLQPPAKFAVIGDPIAHSKSPQLHNPALIAREANAQYIRVQVPAGSVNKAFDLFEQLGFIGVNCTIPHKFEALESVSQLDPLAKALGAVNTVVFREGERLGFNSDGPGFIASVRESFGAELSDLRILIIGAGGGAGRAVAVQSALANCKSLHLINRSPEKAVTLVQELQEMSPNTEIQSLPWTHESLAKVLPNVDLVVNATPIGMKTEDPDLFDLNLLQPSHLVYDMVYRADGGTPFIQKARSIKAKNCDGLVLLLHQGAVSFEHWLGGQAPLEVMRKALFGK